MRFTIAIAALAVLVTATSRAEEYQSPFQRQEQDKLFIVPTAAFTLGTSSYKTESSSLVVGPAGGVSFLLEDSSGEWVFIGDSYLSLLGGLASSTAAFLSAGVGGGKYLSSIEKELILALEYRKSFNNEVESVGLVRLGAIPEPGTLDKLGFEVQYTSFSRIRNNDFGVPTKFNYPTFLFVVRYFL